MGGDACGSKRRFGVNGLLRHDDHRAGDASSYSRHRAFSTQKETDRPPKQDRSISWPFLEPTALYAATVQKGSSLRLLPFL